MAALVGVLAAATAISQFFRNSVGVIATTLAAELHLTADQLGTLTSSFFLVFAICQIPVGIVIDRYGPRAAMLGSALFVVAGSATFAMAGSNSGLILGRLLLGIGCSTLLMAPLVIYSRVFPPQTFATLAGIQISLSSIGTLVATAPLAIVTAQFGWRSAFLATTGLAIILTLAVAVVTRGPSAGPRSDGASETLRATLDGVRRAIRVKGVWQLFLIQFATYSTFGLFIGLWGGPYLAHIHGADLTMQGNLLFVMAVCQIIGTLFWGLADRLVGAYRPVTLAAGFLSVAAMGVLILAGHRLDLFGIGLVVAVLGFVCAFTPVILAHGKSLFPPDITGRGMALLNMGTMSGSFITQWATGLAVKAVAGDALVYPLQAFQLAFTLQTALLIAALCAYASAPDPRRGLSG
jgi:predicted MFS family arabinose efflux permease